MPLPPIEAKKSPIKGILKKPKALEESGTMKLQNAGAASDDEQIRRINFQHHLEMAHKEKSGWVAGEEVKAPEMTTSTAPGALGISLLNASVQNRSQEVVLNAPQPPKEDVKQINYRNLDWAFRDFMRIQEDMIARGHIDSAIKNLEEALNERLAIYPARDDGVWQITQLLADISVKTAVRHINSNQLDEGLNYLKQARKFTEPLPNTDWNEKPEWLSLRKSVFKNMALYHQKSEQWEKALDLFKQSLKLDNSPINPDTIGAANTSLTCAVILSKLNRYAESIEYAQSCMNTIEEQAGIDKTQPLTQYKQTITREGSKANGGRLQDLDKMMTTYSICLHLLGKNLANLKYFKESKMFLQRAAYASSNLCQVPKEELVQAIAKDIVDINKNFAKNVQPAPRIPGEKPPPGDAIEDPETALKSIKSNIANSSYSLAADFQEQKTLISALMEAEEKKKEEEKQEDDKALAYVKKFIEEKKKKEQTAVDEYRTKIQKDFDQKQKEFMEKQQKQKDRKSMAAGKQQPRSKSVAPTNDKANTSTISGGAATGQASVDTSAVAKVPSRPALPNNRNLARSAAVDPAGKPGDFESVEKQTRIKKPEQNLAAEGVKQDNLHLKYSSEKGTKQFFHKRRVNIEKVNEKLGFFGGGILDQPKAEEVVVQGGQPANDEDEFEGNPYEDPNESKAKKNASQSMVIQSSVAGDKKEVSPGKPPKPKSAHGEESGLKLPPVKGYKLDQLGLSEEGEKIVKKSMEHAAWEAGSGKLGVSYKNPQTRKLLENIEKKDYGKIVKARPSKTITQKEVDEEDAKKRSLAKSPEPTASPQPKPAIKEIPTYQPPPDTKDWREDFKKEEASDEELPDTKKLIEKLNKTNGQEQATIGSKGIFDEEEKAMSRGEDSIGADMNDDDVENLKQKTEEALKQKQAALEAAAKIKPPKSKKGISSSQSSTRLPQIGKRFREDSKGSPEKKASPQKSGGKIPADKESSSKGTGKQSPTPQKTVKDAKSEERKELPNKEEEKQRSSSQTPKDVKEKANATAANQKGTDRRSNSAASKRKDKAAKEDTEKNPAEEEEKKVYAPPGQKNKKLKPLEEDTARDSSKGKKGNQSDADDAAVRKRKVDTDRLSQLAQPRAAKSTTRDSEKSVEAEKKEGEEKAKAMINGVSRGKTIDMQSYLDRDVPAMTDKVKKKLTGALPEITGADASGTERRSGNQSVKGGGSDSQKNALNPTSQGGEDHNNDAQRLEQSVNAAKKGLFDLRGLREIENRAAVCIQRHVKGHFTRKWYLNYIVRKRLEVPFSGQEFVDNPFLRQFNKPNLRLQEAAQKAPQMIEVINSQVEQKNMQKKQFRHGSKQKSNVTAGESGGGFTSAEEGDTSKSPLQKQGPKRLKKGTTPQQLMDSLQKEFLASGLDAYAQFKKLGVDALTDENGNPTFDRGQTIKFKEDIEREKKEREDEAMKAEALTHEPRLATVALDPLERMVPRWRGDKVQQFLEVKEVAQYLDRVTRMKEYDEKQKELLKQQQYQNMARQLKKHEITTMASFAKAQGVFNRNPNQRNQEEDDEDYDPLELKKPIDRRGRGPGGPPGGDPDGGGGGGGGDDDSSEDDGTNKKKKKKKQPVLGLRDVPFEEEDGSIPLRMYQDFSREMIVFYKSMGGIHMKWCVQVGVPFEKDKKPYIPIRIYGEPQNSRNLIVMYVMNLELLRISADYYQYHTHTFETIWPFILYLFNNWVRHQVQMLQLTNSKPLFGPDELMAPTDPPVQSPKTLKQGIAAENGVHLNNYYAAALNEVYEENKVILPESAANDEILHVEEGVTKAKQDYDEMLNFSSEIEFDERFDYDQYRQQVRPEALVDRSLPAEKRNSAAELMRQNKKKLFQAYRVQLQQDNKAILDMDQNKEIEEKQKEQGKQNKQKLLYQMDKDEALNAANQVSKETKNKVQLKLNEIYEPLTVKDKNPFSFFLEMHFVSLPNSQSSQYKLMKKLQERPYNEREKLNIILPKDQVNLMNEERRKHLGLLPLTVIDYNCIDRAALKIKLILDCLYMRRQLNGWTLIPRDVKEAYIDSEWYKRKQKIIKQAAKLEYFSLELIKAFGFHVTYAKQYNQQAAMVEKSMQKIQEYKERKQLRMPSFKENDPYAANAGSNEEDYSQRRKGPQALLEIMKEAYSPEKKEEVPAGIVVKDDSRRVGLDSEQAILMSTGRSGKLLGDSTTPKAVEEDKNKGMVETSRSERIKTVIEKRLGSSHGQANEMNSNLERFKQIAQQNQEPLTPVRDDDFQEIPGFNDNDREPDVQDYVRNGEIFEQGIIRIKGTLYIATLVFKRIESNYENMKLLIEDRLKLHAPKSQSHQVEMLKNYKGHLRLRSKLCQFVSIHPDIRLHDENTYQFIKAQERTMLESEMVTKERTRYKTYLEIKVSTKMSDTIWDDSLNLSWEKVEGFYKKFHISWRLYDLLLRRRMNYKERFTFFNFIGPCLSIDETVLVYNPEQFDFENFKYNQIFLRMAEINEFRQGLFPNMNFYNDDYLKLGGFDECDYDPRLKPYYNIDQATEKRKEVLNKFREDGVKFEAAELRPNFLKELAMAAGRMWEVEIDDVYGEEEDLQVQSIQVTRYEEKRRPELLIDEATKHFLLDNPGANNMFNLTLTNFPPADGLFLGKVMLGSKESYRNEYNLRIDYYAVGFIPTLQIKAYNVIYPEAFELKILHRQTIKSFIRVCNLSQPAMITNQLQSAVTIGRKVVGRYFRLNFLRHSLYLSSGIGTQHGQDFFNMAICNENLVRTMLNENYRQYSGVMYFDNLGGRNLVTVSEFEIDMFQQLRGQQHMIHMNKHLSRDQIKAAGDQTNVDHLSPEKRYQKVKLWKINLFNIQNCRTYETVISYDDLHNYYEVEFVFKARNQHQLQRPDFLMLLSDYLRTLYIYRSRVGQLLYWRLPMYKRPINQETGLALEIPPDQMYKLKMLDVYHALQRKIDSLNRHDEMANVIPVSMEQMKAKRSKREPPSLSLRAKLVSEKELPVYDQYQQLRVLKVTSSIIEVLLQRPKIFKQTGTNKPLMTNVTVLLHPMMECWIWNVYIPANQRTYTATFYPSDLFNMNTNLFGANQKKAKNKSATLWIMLIDRAELQRNQTGDILLVIDNFKEPLKEILFQDHVFNDNAKDMFFMEIVMKTHTNFTTDVAANFIPIESTSPKVNDFIIHIRAFSLTRNVWIKDSMPLSEIITILRREHFIIDNIRLLYFSMVRDAAILLSHKIVFSEEAKTVEIKKKTLTYNIKDVTASKEDLEKSKQQHLADIQKERSQLQKGLGDGGLKTENRNLIDQNKIFYQAVIAQNPTQVCTIIYSDVKDLFIYRLFRASDCSNFEKRIPASEIQRTCAPHYHQMLLNRMYSQLGERVANYYMKDMLIASIAAMVNKQKEILEKEKKEKRKAKKKESSNIYNQLGYK